MFVPKTPAEERLLGEPKAVLSAKLDEFLQQHSRGIKLAAANLFGVSRFSAAMLVAMAAAAEALGFSGRTERAETPMKQADVIRLAVAYVLIAASGREAKATSAPAHPAASAAAGAKSPVEVPARGWLDIARSVWTKIGKNRVIAVAAGLTFYGLLAIFPTITALVSVYGLFADPSFDKRPTARFGRGYPRGSDLDYWRSGAKDLFTGRKHLRPRVRHGARGSSLERELGRESALRRSECRLRG